MGHLVPFIAPLLGANGTAVLFDDPQGAGKFMCSYGATKSAQISFARSWQAETASTGPKVCIMTPRPMATATRARFYPGENRDVLASPHDEAKRLLQELRG